MNTLPEAVSLHVVTPCHGVTAGPCDLMAENRLTVTSKVIIPGEKKKKKRRAQFLRDCYTTFTTLRLLDFLYLWMV